ncbi:MAG: hypothetical protein ACREK1_06990, partial [Longimicrobiales bacterium]
SLPEGCSRLAELDIPLGRFVRLKGSADADYPCLSFDAQHSADSEYVLLFENMSPTGGFSRALFPGPPSDSVLEFTLNVSPLAALAQNTAARQNAAFSFRLSVPHPDHDPGASWDFGAGRIHEHIPELPAVPPAGAGLVRGSRIIDLNSAAADPVPGDTIQVLMDGIPRLGISTGNQRAVIRYVSPALIIAEDVRLGTELMREDGGFNRPIAEADLAAIAAEYSAVARVQGDMFFENRHNDAVEASVPHRVTAVHSLMSGDSVWGYTYSVTNYFVWDYWVATDGSTKGLNQHPQRVADNLFMHEIGHMRHFGMLRRNNLSIGDRGNRWLVEGFARFSERMPLAARLLGTTMPSRTGNVVLPRNPAFGNAYFLDDVPTYLNAGSSMYFGYHTSAFVFDYFADQVALHGGDWLAAMREFLIAGGSRTALDAVVQRWLPGMTFAELFTRSRIALYADDIGTPGLPSWTQYHQYRLRESRPAPAHLAGQDPRAAWTRMSPSAEASISGTVAAGGAAGFVIDGAGAQSGLIRITAAPGPNATLSIARVR